MASNNALSNALALASSKTNWTAIVPARAPPPPPPITQATMLKRTHEIQCGKCAMSDYAENIGVWNDDGTLQELGLCGECDEDKAQCVLCSKWDVSATMSYDDAVGEHSCCDCDPKGDVLLGEEECCWEIDCDICGEKQGKDVCPFETGYADDEYVCDECFMCCGECSGSKNPAVGARYGEVCECEDVDDEHNRCIDCDEDFKQTKKTFWGCEVCGLNTCEECCKNDDGYVMCAGCVREQEEKYPICQVCGIDECVDYDDSLCHGCYHKDVGASDCWCAGMSYEDAVGDRARDALKRWAEKQE